MKCPYDQEVGDPPARSRCPLTFDRCWCDHEMLAPSSDHDPQTQYVIKWWLTRNKKRLAAERAQLLATRPQIRIDP